MLRMRNVTKVHRLGEAEIHALREVSLSIQQGESVAVTGPSGSGKSTLLGIMGCLDRPSSGSYSLAGQEITNLSVSGLAEARGRHVGFVFQSFNLLPRSTALENVEMPLVYAGWSRRKRRQRAIEMLDRVGLGGRLSHLPSQLSGGQQQRVAIARALVNRPALILADEPTGALDSQTGQEILTLLEEANSDGATLLVVTHDPTTARRMHRVISLQDGRIASDHPKRLRLTA